MASLIVVFYILIVIFGVIGAGRGWAKEMLIIFSVILALALIAVFEDLLPYTRDLIQDGTIVQFWFRALITIGLVIFGYQTPKFSRIAPATVKRDQIQELLLGLLLGLINGFLIVGTLWSYMDHAKYPFAPHITSPAATGDQKLIDASNSLLRLFIPSTALGSPPWIYVIVVLSFVFVIIVFL